MEKDFLAELRLSEIVLEDFGFLTQRYGFVCTGYSTIGVRYESDTVFVRIFYEFPDGIICLEIGLLNSKAEKGFDLHYVIELSDPEKGKISSYQRASSHSEVQQAVSKLASLLQQYGDKALQGDLKTFARLQTLVDRDTAKAWTQYQESQKVRQQAEAVRQVSEQLWCQGQFEEAHVKAEEALQLAKQGGVSYEIGVAHLILARVEYALGHVDDARLQAKKAQRRFAKYQDEPGTIQTQEWKKEVTMLIEALDSSPYDPSAYLATFGITL